MISDKVKEKVSKDMVFKNPGGGTSTIINVTDSYISYKRGHSIIQLNFNAMDEAYEKFKGMDVYTTDLRKFKPDVFDSKHHGHSCNCTFLFCILRYLGYSNGDIMGAGVRGNTFHINLV